MSLPSPLAFVLVVAGGAQCGVCHPRKGQFHFRQVPVNFRFGVPGGAVGGALGQPVTAFTFIVRGAYPCRQPVPHIF